MRLTSWQDASTRRRMTNRCLILSVESYAFCLYERVELEILVHQVPIDEGMGDPRFESRPVEGRPAAFVDGVIGLYRPGRIQIHDHQVGFIAFADKSALLDLEQDGGVVTH